MKSIKQKTAPVRLNKFISECGIASRRKADMLILEGRVKVNGKVVRDLGVKINPLRDGVIVDDLHLKQEQKVYYLLNKPKGFITSTSDEKKRKTVIELVKTNKKIFPVGRLDYNTTGVLLLTNDGDFANLLLHPSNRFEREYNVLLDKPLSKVDKEKLLRGIVVQKRHGSFKNITPLNKTQTRVKVTTEEGRNHFVKNMFKTLGYTVKRLERTRFANFTVKNIPVGCYRKINKSELNKILNKFN